MLKKDGYTVGIRHNKDYLTAGQKGQPDDELGIPTLAKAFIIRLVDDTARVEYFYWQIPTEKNFKSIDNLIEFVKDEFPL